VTRILNCWLVAVAVLLAGCGTTTEPGAVGVKRPQLLLVPSEEVNQAANKAYQDILAQAQRQGALDRDAAQWRRVHTIVGRLIAQTAAFRQDAPGWQWEVHVLSSKEINAWCMPGGAVLGHEIGHALREHSRERVSAAMAEQMALEVTVNLPYSRRQETEADRVGVELAARAAPEDRMKDPGAYAQKVMPLYLAAAGSPSAGK
jgi:Zn-dependent protease with chaperone function